MRLGRAGRAEWVTVLSQGGLLATIRVDPRHGNFLSTRREQTPRYRYFNGRQLFTGARARLTLDVFLVG